MDDRTCSLPGVGGRAACWIKLKASLPAGGAKFEFDFSGFQTFCSPLEALVSHATRGVRRVRIGLVLSQRRSGCHPAASGRSRGVRRGSRRHRLASERIWVLHGPVPSSGGVGLLLLEPRGD